MTAYRLLFFAVICTIIPVDIVHAQKSTPEGVRALLNLATFKNLVGQCDSNSRLLVRGVFHDATSRSKKKNYPGAVDGSIQFELNHNDNRRIAAVIQPLVKMAKDSHVGFADALALAATVAIKNCGGPLVPYSFGRVDATSAGPSGSIPSFSASKAEIFEKADDMGFSLLEFGTLVAGGHSIATATQLGGGILDSTPNRFDIRFVDEIINRLANPPSMVKRLQSDVNLLTVEVKNMYRGYLADASRLNEDFAVAFEKLVTIGSARLEKYGGVI
ncbi:hypothetical protein HDU97_007607 [Phlyctochytrium planicorne]|nr:hypothetical protein HDU97_007607 [Phlyctochytrium planicorne]